MADPPTEAPPQPAPAVQLPSPPVPPPTTHAPTGRTSSREKLSSNALNYLVWRYLQEAGFAMSASWLGKEWHRKPDEVMPFAPNVKPYQLVHMVQDALFMDDVRADGAVEKHKYRFGDDHGPDYSLPSYDISGDINAVEAQRTRETHSHGLNGFASAAKISKKRSKSKHRHVNGDVMEVDENSYGPSEQASEIDSPVPHQVEIPLLADLAIAENRGTAMEKPRDLFPDSSFLQLPAESIVSQAAWSPSDADPLLIAGEDLLRLFTVRSNAGGDTKFWDVDTAMENFEIEAITWLGGGDVAVSCVESLNAGTDDEFRRSRVMHIPNWGQDDARLLNPLSGVIFALRYDPSTKQLLALAGGSSTTICIYKVTDASTNLTAYKELDSQLYDAAWMTNGRFIACGTNVLQIFEVVSDEVRIVQTHDMRHSWFRIKYDPICDIAAFIDEEMQILRQYSIDTEDTKTQAFTEATITDFDFQPIPNRSSYVPGTPRLLATSTLDGTVQLWDVLNPFTCVNRLSLFGHSVTMQIAFSPDGYLLAAAGYDTVSVWRPEAKGESPKAIWHCVDESLWRSKPVDSDDDWIHSLSWDAHGKRLVYALQDQAVIVRFS